MSTNKKMPITRRTALIIFVGVSVCLLLVIVLSRVMQKALEPGSTPTLFAEPTTFFPTATPTSLLGNVLPTVPPSTPTAEGMTSSSAPVIDSINLSDTIVCDGRRYDVPIEFHDPDGNAHRIHWELLYSLKGTPLYSEGTELRIDRQEQIAGATYQDFIQWYIPGDEVQIRVVLEDRENQSGYRDFEFKCSN